MYEQQNNLVASEHDACAIFARIEKSGMPARGNVEQAILALVRMSHRSGEIEGEGDGCGLLTDIPRALWSRRLESEGLRSELAFTPRFFIAHLFIHRDARGQAGFVHESTRSHLASIGIQILGEKIGHVNVDALGPRGRADEPLFWQIAGLLPSDDHTHRQKMLHTLTLWLEQNQPIHVVSLSTAVAVYKVRGTAQALQYYYPDLQDPACTSAATLAHSRFSTNTATAFERVQPFTLLGHNGEINTISRLRREAEMLGVTLTQNGSDSQDLNRTLESLIATYGLTLTEAMELAFPPIINEVKHFSPELQDLQMHLRQAFGPFAQGPAGIIARAGDECVFSVDALGLRPLWLVETDATYVFTSERGFAPISDAVRDPHPFAPGEKITVLIDRIAGQARLLSYADVQARLLTLSANRYSAHTHAGRSAAETGVLLPEVASAPARRHHLRLALHARRSPDALQAATGWEEDDAKMIHFMIETGKEPIGSLGYDGPLAALAGRRQNLTEFFKESVAVVTNPAIDREREIEHFSTRAVLGRRPSLSRPQGDRPMVWELLSPLLVDSRSLGEESLLTPDLCRSIAHAAGTLTLDDLLADAEVREPHITQPAVVLSSTREPGESLSQALQRLAARALAAVSMGATLLVLDDAQAFSDGQLWIDSHLVVAAVDRSLRAAGNETRRRVSLILRARSLRNLHDLVIALGLGADALVPYEVLEVAALGDRSGGPPADDAATCTRVGNALSALRQGLEKVISTLGIHELRGYDRLFSSIGLATDLTGLLGVPGFAGSERIGLTLARMAEEDAERELVARGEVQSGRRVPNRIYPKIWKTAGQVARGERPFSDFTEQLGVIERESPVSLRHVLDLRIDDSTDPFIDPPDVDTTAGNHAYPLFIGSMSFGSQGETAYRAYAEAAKQLNIIALTGEGGEIKDMLFKYPHTRGIQIASGRFGISSVLLNSANLIEIKIGQGAKPGEGGHLPGKKVSAKVAAARNARPGTDLISPSNNHDIYSIEDLEQIIEELKTTNPRAKISVKVPVVPGIGTIAVGIAKARADIICLSGFDGGTGAARQHALRHVGLPAEIGTLLAHRALVDSGLRNDVEIWCDGGMKSGLDAVKMILMGANRVGYATMAMVALGCTACRACQTDTCHVGIATQIDSIEEATHKGLKRFIPRVFDPSVHHLCTLFAAIGDEIRSLTARLGFSRTQDMVGRVDLLYQARLHNAIDMAMLLDATRVSSSPDIGCGTTCLPAHPPRSDVSRQIANHVMELVIAGQRQVTMSHEHMLSSERAIGTYLSGLIAREHVDDNYPDFGEAHLVLNSGSVPGNGLAAFHAPHLHISVHGGAQDGLAKCAVGGRVAILKARNALGAWVDGSVGKSFAYGAQRGLFIVQGNADSRAGIRLSGADLLIGGEISEPLADHLGALATRANIKGFAFEYMTQGRAVVLGDPGPWMCSGMTGGAVYLRLRPDLGFDQAAIERRVAKGAKVQIAPLGDGDWSGVCQILSMYRDELVDGGQNLTATYIGGLIGHARDSFVKIVPQGQQVDESISTE